eukprot:CAMPEP_0114514590 /NCGR_PEP_ID=MMETSP0109-20121206/16235_1 /TAXON_ID=29199 /ORGANISM="Chlorarachnion reptans, Strain CCCM449" /LENGTH=352 /DNA_ID=CAMNT_0001694641 /DNA_START=39 /DNA_END=1097 /DNA_ORIENTATION=-
MSDGNTPGKASGDAELKATLTKTVVSGNRATLHLYLTAILGLLFLLGLLSPSSAQFLAMIPANTAMVHFRIWNLVTAAYYENSLLMGALNIGVALVVGRMLERKWGAEYLKLMVAVNLATMVSIFIIMVACYATTMSDTFLFSPVCGFSAANAAFGVALKQLAPEQNCISSIDAIKFKDIPAVVVACAIACNMLGLTLLKDLLLVIFGTYFGWLYLRYFMAYPGSSLRGDTSEHFAFKMLFPVYVRPIGAMFGNLSFWACEACGFCKVVEPPQEVQTSKTSAPELPDVPETTDAERQVIERRRALAMKAINKRLEELRAAKQRKAASPSPVHPSEQSENGEPAAEHRINVKE